MSIKKSLRIFIYIPLISIALFIFLGFLNMFHPFFDSLSHFRVHLLVLFLITLLLTSFFHEKRIMLFYVMVLLMGSTYLYALLQPFKAEPVNETKINHVRHLQFNLNFKNQRLEEVKDFLKENSVDIITLQEVTPEHQAFLEQMKTESFVVEFSKDYPYISMKKGAYPYQQYCDFQSVGGVAVLSKYPINKENSICMEGVGLLSSEVMIKDQPIHVVSIHLYWPFPYYQEEQVQTLVQVFEHFKNPMLIAGDFNAVAWSHSVKQIEKASNTKVVNGLRWSISLEKQLPLIPLKLSIDHVLLSSEFQVDDIYIAKPLGSDHFPLVTEFRF